jgi:hypothetical protein
MNLQTLAPDSHHKAIEDHSYSDFVKDDGGVLAIYLSGHYTVPELQAKLRQLVEATTLHADKQISLPL